MKQVISPKKNKFAKTITSDPITRQKRQKILFQTYILVMERKQQLWNTQSRIL